MTDHRTQHAIIDIMKAAAALLKADDRLLNGFHQETQGAALNIDIGQAAAEFINASAKLNMLLAAAGAGEPIGYPANLVMAARLLNHKNFVKTDRAPGGIQ